jgi:hypothetical protein
MEVAIMFRKTADFVEVAIVLILLGFITFPGTGVAARGNTCSFQGAWLDFDTDGQAYAIATVQGQSQASGTVVLEVPGVDPTLFGSFPTTVRVSDLRGVWERNSGNYFRWVVIGLGVDENGATVWIGKLIGTSTILDDCNTEYIQTLLEVYLPNQNPFADEAALSIPLDSHYGNRMLLAPSGPN